MNNLICTETPVSWLALEQFNLGELSPERNQEIKMHLQSCNACDSAMNLIVNDSMVLKPLPNIEHESWFSQFFVHPVGAGSIVAVIAALMIVVILWPSAGQITEDNFRVPPAQMNYKGGDLAISLVRNRNGLITSNPVKYIDGDRFTVNLTCPPGKRDIELVVFQGGETYFPIDATQVFCGNSIPLPAGFRLTGSKPAVICVIVDELPSRFDIQHSTPATLSKSSVCYKLSGF